LDCGSGGSGEQVGAHVTKETPEKYKL